jgi:hypothetical protein
MVAVLPAAALTVLAPQPASATTAIQFPLDTTQTVIKSEQPAPWCYASQNNCHHDYNAADIHAPTGTRVLSPVDGTVVSVTVASTGVGSRVQIKAADGYLWYLAHMDDSPGPLVVDNQTVSRGTPLGYVGTSAHAMGTDPHLHIDKLPTSYNSRPSCSGSDCTQYPFINIQPVLIEAFAEIDSSAPSAGTGVNSGAAVFVSNVAHVTGIKTSTGVLYKNTLTSPPSGWQSLSGTVEGTPSLTYHDGRYDAFATSPSGVMYMKTWTSPTTGWTAWSSIGGSGLNDAAAVWANSEYHVFSVDTAGHLRQRTYANGAWTSTWEDLGGVVEGTPAVTFHDGRYDVFAHSPGGIMYQKTWRPSIGWGAWVSLGGSDLTGGAGAVYAESEYHVFGINTSGELMQRTWDGSWGTWQNLGGTVAGTPAATFDNGNYHVFARSPGGTMYRKSYTTSWSGWVSIGGDFS